MSLGKLPIFRNLVPGHHKRRLKPDLTTDMISSPMGDFRHTMHVGRGGDVFGDTSFLSEHGGEGAREGASSNRLVRALRNARRAPARNSSPDVSPPPPPVSPIIKNAVSLPHLLDTDNGTGVQRLNFKTAMSSPGIMDGSYGLESGFCTLPRWSRMEKSKEREAKVELVKATEEMEVVDLQLPRTDSMMSFSLDLGPSLLSEVLAVMGSRGERGAQTPEKESPSGRENGMRLVKFQLEGPPDQLDGEGSRPMVTSLSGLRGRFQQEAWMDAPMGEGEEERPPLGPAASAVYGRPTPEERRWAAQTRGDGPTPAAEPSLGLGVHLASSGERDARGRWGSPQGSEADGDGSWRPPRPRVPADGEEDALGHAERPWSAASAAQETGFNPLKAEAFAFADEDEEIRV
ncbi:cdc42 effector protein 1 [Amblyraja radiata]|uniref:cdc42 effector protein 1 n=1 Tax=Amblyraja radiata TaxID=386614 RepID=UPI0014027ABB|nr:cdc42 effector protein 1 [Amblyraja radiata]